MKVAVRADASIQIGTGHVMRCLTLAEELRRRGAKVLFICRRHQGNLCGLISGKGFQVECLPGGDAAVGEPASPSAQLDRSSDDSLPAHAEWLGADLRQDATQAAQAIENVGGVDWLVVDHYALDARWESRLRAAARHIMVIDDLADRRHDCELLLDQNLYPEMERRYEKLVPSGCHTLFGPEYALLRPEFAEARKALRSRNGTVKRVLISFGGVDATNETRKALEALCGLESANIDVEVVIGAANPHRDELTQLCARRPKTRLHVQTDRMAELMAAADLAIGGGGVETWERCAVGCPALIVALADNQVPIAKAIDAAGAAYYLGPRGEVSVAMIRDALRDTVEAPERLAAAAQNCLALVDADGCSAVAAAVEATP